MCLHIRVLYASPAHTCPQPSKENVGGAELPPMCLHIRVLYASPAHACPQPFEDNAVGAASLCY